MGKSISVLKNMYFVEHMIMLNLSLKELELKAKNRSIKDYKRLCI